MTAKTCPNCKSENTCEIMYGLPVLDDELEKRLDEGKIHLGGCVIEEDAPDYHCNACSRNFIGNE